MSDNLVKRLQDPPFGTETSERNLMAQAAARIAELEAERDKFEALALLNLQENRTHIARTEAAEAQVAKLVEALRDIIDTGGAYGSAAHMARVDAIARAALQEPKP